MRSGYSLRTGCCGSDLLLAPCVRSVRPRSRCQGSGRPRSPCVGSGRIAVCAWALGSSTCLVVPHHDNDREDIRNGRNHEHTRTNKGPRTPTNARANKRTHTPVNASKTRSSKRTPLPPTRTQITHNAQTNSQSSERAVKQPSQPQRRDTHTQAAIKRANTPATNNSTHI